MLFPIRLWKIETRNELTSRIFVLSTLSNLNASFMDVQTGFFGFVSNTMCVGLVMLALDKLNSFPLRLLFPCESNFCLVFKLKSLDEQEPILKTEQNNESSTKTVQNTFSNGSESF